MIKKNKGFTLIELLVVIAIIGVLAAVVLSSVGSARTKATDAKVQAQLSNMRSQAQLYTGTGTAFPLGTCATTVGTLFDTANNGLGTLLSGLTLTGTASRCYAAAGLPSNGTAWAVAVATTSGAFCVDSTGVARSTNASGTAYGTDTSAVITGTACL